MSAVSSESPRTSADFRAEVNGRSGANEPSAPGGADDPRRPGVARGPGETEQAGQAGRVTQPHAAATSTDFGANEWLVDELYQRYLADPGSVDRAWWNFFADYHPKPPEPPATSPSPFTAAAAPPAPAVAPPPAAGPPASLPAPASAPPDQAAAGQ